MKLTLIFHFWMLVFAFTATAQSTQYTIDNLPEKGLLLDTGWKFKNGDNSSWATRDYNDRAWQGINPSLPLHSLPQAQNTVGWLRLTFKMNDTLKGRPISICIEQFGASEIYLNGKKLYTFGNVSTDANNEVGHNPQSLPVTLPLSNDNQQVLAIRYSAHSPALYNITTMLPMFNATLFLPQYGEKWYKRNIDSGFNQTIVTGLFLMLSILHLFLYLSHRKKSINLLFSIYAFTMAIAQFRGVFGATKPLMTEQFISSFLFNISAPFAGMVFLYAIYTYFDQRKKNLFYILLVCCILSSLHQFISGDPMKQLSTNLAVVLTLIEAARIGYIGMKKGIQGGTLFFAGQIASVITFLLLPVASIYSPWSFFYLFSYDVAFLIPPLLVSFILARDFGSTNKLLTQQLKDIEGLSAINLAQEQEKRLLLANQNTLLEQQVAARTVELQSSLEDLKQTQAQLIQSEKMASLGELTAGIAHEIQNPLNFVNNFSDVSIELLEEMGEELDKGDTEEVKAISANLKLNLEKIAHHGRRADSIVKGMLQHSRTSTGQKEPTDVNALADEYLRLAYHGLRAKDKSFNADLVTNFGESLPKVNAISQDLGRVLLNLFTNAFYATQQKSKQFTDGSYKPVVEVVTIQQHNSVQIIVKDNGTGIPDAIKDKILQPFFTTKPTGEGTGLGLSLSYDIVVKVHNGTINIESTEGEGCTFFINIPL